MKHTPSVKVWIQAHKWSSLVSTVSLLVLCLTGLPLVFTDEIEAWTAPSKPLSVVTTAPRRTLDMLVQDPQLIASKRFVQFVFWPDAEPEQIGLGLANVADAPLEEVSRVLVDARSGRIQSEAPAESGPLHTLLDLHRNLCAGRFGEALLGVVALLFVISTVSGVVIYGPFMRRLDFGVVRNRSPRLKWLDLHNLVGIATAAWALVVGATGLINTLESPLFGLWQAEQLPALLAPHAKDAPTKSLISLDAAVATARTALPGMEPASIGVPGTRYATPRHYLVWMHGTQTLTKRLFTPVLVDAAKDKLVQVAPLPWYLRALEISRPLHFGDYAGR